jgi:hypothetical protein
VAALGAATRDGLGDQLFLAGPDLHHVTRAFALVEGGRIPAAAEVAAAGRATATAGGMVANSSWLALVSARVALAAGQIPEAELWARTAATGFAESDLPGPLRLALAAELLGAAWRNDREQAAALDHTLLGFGHPGLGFLEPDVVRARAWAQAAAGDLATAGDLLDQAATLAADTGQWTLRSSALHDRVRLGDAAAVVGALQELVGRVDGRLTTIRARHAAALAGDDPDELLTVSSAFAHFGAALLAAEAATQAAAAWRRAGRRHRSEEARRIAAELRRRCPEASTPALRALLLADLSPREREVCTLAETDRTSREIAGQLGISVRTVDNLLHRAPTPSSASTAATASATPWADRPLRHRLPTASPTPSNRPLARPPYQRTVTSPTSKTLKPVKMSTGRRLDGRYPADAGEATIGELLEAIDAARRILETARERST